MTWIQVLTIVLANIGWSTTMFLWLRKEANADRKELASAINDNRKEISALKMQMFIFEERHKK